MNRYCQNQLCEHESTREVQVSVEGPSDETRSLCGACKVAFDWGVEHGRMTRKRRKVWVLAIADRGIVVQGTAFGSKQKAVQGLVKYLKTHEDYSGAADMAEVSEWLAEHDERLGVDIFPTTLDLS